MALNPEPPPIDSQSIRLAKCWRITRKDGTVLHFTDHNCEITVLIGGFALGAFETFSPSSGFQVTTRDEQEGESTYALEGAIGGSFLLSDILDKRFNEAIVDEYLVDWKYPWSGPYRHRKYWMGAASVTDLTFSAPLEGAIRFMKQTRNKRISKVCPYALFDADTCKASSTNKVLTYDDDSVVVDDVLTSRVVFDVTFEFSAGFPDGTGVFDDGEITWTSGANDGTTSNIQSSVDLGDTGSERKFRITVYGQTLSTVADGDQLTISVGCDRLIETCHSKFANVLNFGGEPHIPGVSVAQNPDKKPNQKG